MRKAVDLHTAMSWIAKEFHHSMNECWNEERDVTARHVRDLSVDGQRLQTGAQPLERPATFVFVTGHRDGGREVGQRLRGRRDHHERRGDRAEQADHTLEHGLGAEGQQRLGGSHPRRSAAAQHDGRGRHGTGKPVVILSRQRSRSSRTLDRFPSVRQAAR